VCLLRGTSWIFKYSPCWFSSLERLLTFLTQTRYLWEVTAIRLLRFSARSAVGWVTPSGFKNNWLILWALKNWTDPAIGQADPLVDPHGSILKKYVIWIHCKRCVFLRTLKFILDKCCSTVNLHHNYPLICKSELGISIYFLVRVCFVSYTSENAWLSSRKYCHWSEVPKCSVQCILRNGCQASGGFVLALLPVNGWRKSW